MGAEVDRIIREIAEQYAKVLPQDRQDTQIYMNQSTLDALAKSAGFPDDSIGLPTRIFGLSVIVDNRMPSGVAELRTETEPDRVIRRANAAGHTFNFVKFEPLPEPTLRALLRSYWKRIRRWKA